MMTKGVKGVVAGRRPPHTPGEQLAAHAAAAAEVRGYQTHPDVVALRVERVRVQVDRMCWAGILLALAFTMTNVQAFAAAGAPAWSPRWWTAWQPGIEVTPAWVREATGCSRGLSSRLAATLSTELAARTASGGGTS